MEATEELPQAKKARPASKERLEARIGAEQKRILQRAADIQGRSLSDFIIAASYREAMHTIEQQVVLSLGKEDSEFILQEIVSDEQPNQRLREAAADYKARVGRRKKGA